MLGEFVDGCAKHIDTFFESILQYVDKVSGIVGGLCGIAAFLYIGAKVWGNYSRGESIEIYPLLRPFVIGLLCANFNVVVVGGLRGLADPVCEYFQGLEEQSNQTELNAKFQKSVENARKRVADLVDKKEAEAKAQMSDWEKLCAWFGKGARNFKNWLFCGVAWLIGWIADILAALTKFVLIFTRCFSLSILCLLGPLVFAISIFPGYKQGLNQWIARFVCIYMWMPLFSLCDIFINNVTGALGNVLLDNVNVMIDQVLMDVNNVSIEEVEKIVIKLQGVSANFALIGALVSILTASLYKSVPTLASWIIAGGDASGQLSSIAGFANNAALGIGKIASIAGGAAALAATKGAGSLVRQGAAIAGNHIGNAGAGMLGIPPGRPSASMGAGPLDAPARTPIGFHASSHGKPSDTVRPYQTQPSGGETGMASQGSPQQTSSDDSAKLSKGELLAGRALLFVARQLKRPQLNHMMRYGNARERYNAATDPYAPRSILKKALKDGNIFVQQAALGNARTAQSPRLLKRAVKYGFESVSTQAFHMLSDMDIKDHPVQQVFNALIDTSSEAPTHPRRGGKREVARNASPAAATIPSGANGPAAVGDNPDVRQEESESTEPKKLSRMERLTGKTLLFVARQLKRPQLRHMMRYGNDRERYKAATDPYASRSILKKALKDGNIFVQQAALGNARTAQSTRLLKRAAKYGFEEVSNQATAMLSELKQNKNNEQNDVNQQ